MLLHLCLFYTVLTSISFAQSSDWIDGQYNASLRMLLDNIFDNGTVIASPSTQQPDYYYHWIRDAAMVVGHLVHRYELGEDQHKDLILSYARHEQKLQHTPNPSGEFSTGGLGEPKFNVDGSQYTGPWGRPQNDGPAIRAVTLSRFAMNLLGNMSIEAFKSQYPYLYYPDLGGDSTIKSDLEYITHHWADLSFDPWEESYAFGHFFNSIAQREALTIGAKLARKLDDPGAADWYDLHVKEINNHLKLFWNQDDTYIRCTVGHEHGVEWKTNNLDTSVIIAVLFANSTSPEDPYSIISDKVMSTFVALNTSFAKTYPINAGHFSPCFGRYEQDRYDGVDMSIANPWFLNTLAAAEYLYTIIPYILNPTLTHANAFNLSHPFFEAYQVTDDISTYQNVLGLETERQDIACKVARDADGRMDWIKKYRTEQLELSEQFSRITGEQIGAKRLTWSYEAFLKAADRRRKLGDWIETCYSTAS